MVGNSNNTKIQEGLWLQKQAKELFDAAEFEEAYYLYEDAEKSYREGFTSPGTRVFFMQCTKLRCLEELLENGRAELNSLYSESLTNFLDEWNESAITLRITPDRRSEALIFRLFRLAAASVSHQIYEVNTLIDLKEFDKARQSLDHLVSRLEANPFPESDALLTILRSKRCVIDVKEEMTKPERIRDHFLIHEAYAAAAKHSQLPETSTSKQRERIEAYRNWLLSCSEKFKAFGLLNAQQTVNVLDHYSLIQRVLSNAIDYAEKAIATSGSFDPELSGVHVAYLRFWHAIVSERLCLSRFMQTGESTDFDQSLGFWKTGLDSARFLVAHKSESSFFPNRFYSLEDLKLEEHFLNAARAFREERWSDTVCHLENWRNQFPVKYRWSWRDIQIYTRLLFAKALDSFSKSNEQDLRQICTELKRLERTEPIGNVGRFFVSESEALLMRIGFSLDNQWVNLVCQHFPLDSYTDKYETANEIDLFQSLPRRVYSWLTQSRSAFTLAEVEECKARILGCVEFIAGHIYEYHMGVLVGNNTLAMSHIDSPLQKLLELTNTHWKERKPIVSSVQRLKEAIDQLQDLEDVSQYEAIYQKIHGAIKGIMRVMPVTIEIKSAEVSEHEPKGIEATPDWMLSQSHTGREKLFVFPDRDVSIKPGKSYLSPEWRKGNRISVPAKADFLIPIHYVPQWEFWEKEAANASWLVTEGVKYAYLREAIELARKTPVSSEKPKVGAILLKDGIIVSKAYKNEPPNTGHAEELAIRKCKRADLQGATLITTLEPCTLFGRTADVASCANLILQNGIAKVIIGLSDPNPKIGGTGEQLLGLNNIAIGHFPINLWKEIWQINKGFIEKYTRGSTMEVRLYKPPIE